MLHHRGPYRHFDCFESPGLCFSFFGMEVRAVLTRREPVWLIIDDKSTAWVAYQSVWGVCGYRTCAGLVEALQNAEGVRGSFIKKRIEFPQALFQLQAQWRHLKFETAAVLRFFKKNFLLFWRLKMKLPETPFSDAEGLG